MINTLFIANRGEIAIRIARTCRRLGIRSIAAYTAEDAGSAHLRAVDLAVRVPSYLDVAALVAAALDSGAQAVHPGYGFLSENAAFAEAVTAAGLAFVGPSAPVIARMGSKIAAKGAAEEAGVPILPGFAAEDADDATLIKAAESVGFPLLVKASAGGGGKGMRLVETAADLPSVLLNTRREAMAAFGDGRLMLERFVRRPRHVEVQVLADAHGTVLHLLDRDCSIQRRHQKVVEEAPAPDLGDQRDVIGPAAVRLAEAIGYTNVGTVEFILDQETGEAFFLEMNTRLQVEHPVTEMVTGLDLVEWQLRIAAGERLTLRQDEIRPQGHAVEVRLNAEDPAADYAPQTGRVSRLHPPEGEGVRSDLGLAEGMTVTPHFDPMLGKIIAWGPDRAQALDRLGSALDGLVVEGLVTNAAFLRDVLRHPAFLAGPVSTRFLEEGWPQGWQAAPAVSEEGLRFAALAVLVAPRASPDPWQALSGWRVGARAGLGGRTRVVLEDAAGERHALWVERSDAGYRVDDREMRASLVDGALEVEDATAFRRVPLRRDGANLSLTLDGAVMTFRVLDLVEAELGGRSRDAAGGVTAPAPGVVVAVEVAVGDTVTAGQPLAVLESMKLHHTLSAPAAGRVAAIYCAAGDPVQGGDVLFDLDPTEEA